MLKLGVSEKYLKYLQVILVLDLFGNTDTVLKYIFSSICPPLVTGGTAFCWVTVCSTIVIHDTNRHFSHMHLTMTALRHLRMSVRQRSNRSSRFRSSCFSRPRNVSVWKCNSICRFIVGFFSYLSPMGSRQSSCILDLQKFGQKEFWLKFGRCPRTWRVSDKVRIHVVRCCDCSVVV